jgi:exodeoxyribonuclease VII small subunit
MAKAELTYNKAFARLQEIVAEIEGGEIDVDALTASVKEATQLVAFCRSRLTTTQREIAQALEEVEAAAQPVAVASEPEPEDDEPVAPAKVAPQRQAAPAPTPKAPSPARRQPALADTDDFDPFAGI